MTPETLTLIKDWGFPAALCLYLLWRIDRTFVPGFTATINATRDMSAAVEANAKSGARILALLEESFSGSRNDAADLAAQLKDTWHEAHLARLACERIESRQHAGPLGQEDAR